MSLMEHLLQHQDTGALSLVKGHADKFVVLSVIIGKRAKREFTFNGDETDKIEMFERLLEGGKTRVVGQAVGTITQD